MSLNPIPDGPGLLVSVKTGLGGKDRMLEAGGWVKRMIEGGVWGLEEKGKGAAPVAGVPMNRGKSWGETFVEGKA